LDCRPFRDPFQYIAPNSSALLIGNKITLNQNPLLPSSSSITTLLLWNPPTGPQKPLPSLVLGIEKLSTRAPHDQAQVLEDPRESDQVEDHNASKTPEERGPLPPAG